MSSFPSVSIPNITMPVPSIMMPTSGYFCGGGSSLGFIMGGGTPSSSTIPMSRSVSSGVGVSFGWKFPSGFGDVSSQDGGSSM
jgi:hypothetical protein